jgi:hypothetical protein
MRGARIRAMPLASTAAVTLCVLLVAAFADGPASASTAALPATQRVLQAGELAGMKPMSPPAVVRGASAWVTDSFPKSSRNEELARFRSLGFVAGIDENLVTPGNTDRYGLSLMEEFSSAKAARAELAHAQAVNPTWAHFAVPGIPGARGFELTHGASPGRNVGFTDGPFYYIIGAGWLGRSSNAVSRDQLISSAVVLYHRVHGH